MVDTCLMLIIDEEDKDDIAEDFELRGEENDRNTWEQRIMVLVDGINDDGCSLPQI